MVHGTAVAFGPAAVLITGPSGTGKSTLALELLAIGATLVADDRVVLTRKEDAIFASPGAGLEGRIEAHGVGILRTDWVHGATLQLVADLGAKPDARLPAPKTEGLLGYEVPLIAIGGLHRAAPILRAILLGGLERSP